MAHRSCASHCLLHEVYVPITTKGIDSHAAPRSAEIQWAMSLRSQETLENLRALVTEHPNDGTLWQLIRFVALETKE